MCVVETGNGRTVPETGAGVLVAISGQGWSLRHGRSNQANINSTEPPNLDVLRPQDSLLPEDRLGQGQALQS